MSKLSEFLTNIANAIRNLKGTTEPINAQNFATEINSMKEALDDTTATPEDIVVGKTAFVKGQKVEGTYKTPTSLKALLDYTKSTSYMFYYNSTITDLTGYIDFEDTSNVTDTSYMFCNCYLLTKIPLFDTSKVTTMSFMFRGCDKLTEIPLFDTSKVTVTFNMFENCRQITEITLFDTSKFRDISHMFSDCVKLETINMINMVNVDTANGFLINCKNIKNLIIKNLKIGLQVGSGSSWGYKISLDSLIGLCQECVNVNASRTLTVGSVNITKLANVYVKLTNQPEEDETLPKLPMVQCESTDEGAMTISQYMALKNWQLA